jgi:hypothetical protein
MAWGASLLSAEGAHLLWPIRTLSGALRARAVLTSRPLLPCHAAHERFQSD